MKKIVAALAVLAIPGCYTAASQSDMRGGVVQGTASVIDGDTLDIHGTRIRLNGIDAPESAQTCQDSRGVAWRCGQRAALALSDKIGRNPVSCRPTDTDRYGRVVADCSVGGDSLNRWMVNQGWAVAYRQYSTAHVATEAEARSAGRGVWQGRFDMPWDWRAARRNGGQAKTVMPRLVALAGQGQSCGARKTCAAFKSCDAARWHLKNCPWGGSLDRDGDGVPCESIC